MIADNDYAGLGVYNGGNYRTGWFLTAATLPNNNGPFETVEVGATGDLAVDMGQLSFVDLRQVLVGGQWGPWLIWQGSRHPRPGHGR